MSEELPKGWAWATIDDLQAAETRAITDGPFGSNLASRHYTDTGARVIRLQNIGDGNFIDERAYISLEHFETLKKHEVRQGDIVIASLGNDLPRATSVPDLGGPAIVKADCIRFRPSRLVDPAWIVYALSAPCTKANVQERIRGIGRPRLGLGEIRKIRIPIPPLAEQWRVVGALESELSRLDVASRQISRSLDSVEKLVKSIRRHVLEADSEGKPGKLGDLLAGIEAGKSFACEARPAHEGEWGIIKVSAMTWGEFKESENKALIAGRDFDPKFEINSGDILVSRANTREYVGAPVLVGKVRSKLLLSDKSLRLIPGEGVDRDWLIQLLSSPQVREQISNRATGTKDSMRNISQKSLMDVEVKIPESSRQHELALRVQEGLRNVSRLRSALLLARKRADHLRQALLTAAFTGKLIPQDPADEPAAALLERIRSERASAPTPKRARRSTTKPSTRLASTTDVRTPEDPQPVHAGEQTALEF